MQHILLLTALLLSACSVDLSKLRRHNYPTDAPSEKPSPDLFFRDASPHMDADPNSNIPADAQLDLFLDDISHHPDAAPDISIPADAQLDLFLDDISHHPDATPDLSIPADAQLDLFLDDISHHPDVAPDLSIPADARQDLFVHDLAPKSPIGSNCVDSPQCASGFCTNNVCCNVAQCVDTCVPDGITTCPTYSGWTCSPYGTCRGY